MRGAIAALPLLLAGCVVGPDYRGPPAVAPAAVARGAFVRAGDPAFRATPGVARWWTTLGDPVLDGLVDRALARSPDIAIAQARIRQAAASLGRRKAAGLPEIGASATYIDAKFPGVNIGNRPEGTDADGADGEAASTAAANGSSELDFYSLGLNASWEISLFGGAQRAVEETRATVERGHAALADAQVSLAAQVVVAYAGLREAQAGADNGRRAVAILTRLLAMTERRAAAGTAVVADVAAVREQLAAAKADVHTAAAETERDMDILAALAGDEPGALDATLASAAPVPLPPPVVAIADPAALIARRPDVRAAERELASRTASIGVAKAKLLPGIKLQGLLGLGGAEPGDVFRTGMLTTLLAPSLSWSPLDFGRNRAGLREARGARDEAEARYDRAVLDALQDAETALSRFGRFRRELGEKRQAAAATDLVLEGEMLRVRAGTAALPAQLAAQRRQIAARIAVAGARARLLESFAHVEKSVGLGWTGDEASPRSTRPAEPGR